MNELSKNQILTVTIDSYGSEAQGVAHADGRAVFVPGAIPGEEWEIRILKVTAGPVYARGERLLKSSPMRVRPDCPYFGKCGGCNTRHLSYEEELRFKREKVNAALVRIGKQQPVVDRILGCEEADRYRNKAIFSLADGEGGPAWGFYRSRSHQLIPMEDCLLQSELSCRAASAVRDFLASERIPAYEESSGKGSVRHVFCRQAYHRTDAVVCVVSARGFGDRTSSLVGHLLRACPELSGIVLNINRSRGNTVLSGDFYTLWGRSSIRDSLCGLEYEIAPQAFFQINPPQAERLYRLAGEYALENKPALIFDLYCGAGTISLFLARSAQRVIGAEIVPEAVENAAQNALRNRVSNVEFLWADAGEAAARLAARGLRPDVVVVDPPRKGMSESAINAVSSMEPQRIVYVSCDPATLARDILRFQQQGYSLQRGAAVDMFPRTCHVESVVLLSRGDGAELP